MSTCLYTVLRLCLARGAMQALSPPFHFYPYRCKRLHAHALNSPIPLLAAIYKRSRFSSSRSPRRRGASRIATFSPLFDARWLIDESNTGAQHYPQRASSTCRQPFLALSRPGPISPLAPSKCRATLIFDFIISARELIYRAEEGAEIFHDCLALLPGFQSLLRRVQAYASVTRCPNAVGIGETPVVTMTRFSS